MKYRIEAIDDEGRVVEGIDLEGLKIIPPDGALLVTVPYALCDADMARLRHELRTFFGDNRKVGVVRSGEVEFIHFPDPVGVSAEGASWANDPLGADYAALRALGGT